MSRILPDFVIKGLQGQLLTCSLVVDVPVGSSVVLYLQNITGGDVIQLPFVPNPNPPIIALTEVSWEFSLPLVAEYVAEVWVEQIPPDPLPLDFVPITKVAAIGRVSVLPSARIAHTNSTTPAQQILAALNASLLGSATEAQKMMIIGNMTLVSMGGSELLLMKRHFQGVVNRELGIRTSKIKVHMK